MFGARRLRYQASGLATTLLLSACGGADICLNCDPSTSPTPSNRVIVTGNISRTNPFLTDFSDVFVFVCIDAGPGVPPLDCPESFFTNVSPSGSFTTTNGRPGPETVYFVWDMDGTGRIEPDDSFSLLQDPDMVLANVQGGQTVMLEDAVVDFTTLMATAAISVGQTPTPTPTAVPSITPTPTTTATATTP